MKKIFHPLFLGRYRESGERPMKRDACLAIVVAMLEAAYDDWIGSNRDGARSLSFIDARIVKIECY